MNTTENIDTENINTFSNSDDSIQFFLPSPSDANSAELVQLFKDLEQLISNYARSNPHHDENQVRRYAAGHLCFDMMKEEFIGKFFPIKKFKKLSAWSIFLKENLKKEKASKENMKKVSQDFEQIKQNKEEMERLETIAKQETVLISKYDMKTRHSSFEKHWKMMLNNMRFFKDNYRTHLLLYRVTDTKHDVLYPSAVVHNSGKYILYVYLENTIFTNA